MRVFMACAAMSVFLLVAIAAALLVHRALGILIWNAYSWLTLFPAYDFSIPLGFRLFSWLVRQ